GGGWSEGGKEPRPSRSCSLCGRAPTKEEGQRSTPRHIEELSNLTPGVSANLLYGCERFHLQHVGPQTFGRMATQHATAGIPGRPGGSGERLQQRLGLLQVSGVEALGEPAVNRRERLARLILLALMLPKPSKAHAGSLL